MRSDVRFSGFPLQEWRLSVFWHFKTVSSLLGVTTEWQQLKSMKMQTDLQTLVSSQAVPSLRGKHTKGGGSPLSPGQGHSRLVKIKSLRVIKF